MSHLATFTEFHDYFAAIAASHVDIAGFRFGDKEVVQCASRSTLPPVTLWVENYEPVTIQDSRSDNFNGDIRFTMAIMAPMPGAWADQRTLYSALEVIAKDIISKMLKDWNDGLMQAQINGWKYGWAEISLGATSMLSCRMDLSILRPERLVYNELKWE